MHVFYATHSEAEDYETGEPEKITPVLIDHTTGFIPQIGAIVVINYKKYQVLGITHEFDQNREWDATIVVRKLDDS